MNTLLRKRIGKALLLVLSAFAIGTIGFYLLLDHLSFIDSLYLTIITLTTVGYGDFTPHNNMPPDGNPYVIKLFAVFIILFGMGSVLYVLSVLTEYLVSGDLARIRNEKRMRKLVSSLRGHYIICGGGQAGFYIMDELKKTLRTFVLIEKAEERIRDLLTEFTDLLYIQGDATQDEVLEQAGLKRSAGVVTALPDEKDNLFIVMSIGQKRKESGGKFRIAAKVEHLRKMEPKLRSAGADCIISPERISSRRMVSEMFRPSVTTFLDRMLNDRRAVIRVEEVTVSSGTDLAGKTLMEARIPDRTGLLIVAVRKSGTEGYILNPGPEQVIGPDDVLVVMGAMDNVSRLRKLAEGK
jgi:voltage-gated potassium channel